MTIPAKWASNGAVKIERAKEHINNLESAIFTRETSPYRLTTEEDPETGDLLWVLEVPEPPPLRFGAIAGDAIHNLRSALDILWRQVMERSGRKDYFPICASADDFKARYGRQVKSRHKPVMDLIKQIEPYQGGCGEPLWFLDQLDKADKHHVLIPARVGAVTAVDALWDSPLAGVMFVGSPILVSQQRTIVHRVAASDRGKVDMNPQISLQIAFGEVEVLKGEPMLPVLRAFLKAVEGVIEAFVAAGLLQ